MERSEVQRGSINIVWKTDILLNKNNGYIKSTMFKFGRYNCSLCIPKCFNGFSVDGVREVDLITENCPVDSPMFSKKTEYTLILTDNCGKAFLKASGITHKENKIIMMVLFQEYLEKYQNELLSEEGTVTFRLSWNPLNDVQRHGNTETHTICYQDTQTQTDLKPEDEPSSLLENLSNDLKCIYESQVDTDCVLSVGETQFPVHRTVLSARSTVFSAMFHHDMSESRTGEVDITDVEATSMGDVLYYIYSGKVRGLSEDTATTMYTLADKYALIELRDICLQFLIHNLTSDNVCDVAVLAHTHAEIELEERVVEFIEASLDEIEESDKWIQFSKARPLLALKLVRSALRAAKRENINNTRNIFFK